MHHSEVSQSANFVIVCYWKWHMKRQTTALAPIRVFLAPNGCFWPFPPVWRFSKDCDSAKCFLQVDRQASKLCIDQLQSCESKDRDSLKWNEIPSRRKRKVTGPRPKYTEGPSARVHVLYLRPSTANWGFAENLVPTQPLTNRPTQRFRAAIWMFDIRLKDCCTSLNVS